ncbi:SoxR reducing system RseC family protein [Algibacillus agarilyticus]|uniref:SoxR reducing system RseC family protein n=1 Tax=Algibacillus agarilyticus TaxID=2234133 RepID=UPI000DD0917C|nr:SoxR reducing system RseC family protein [Algibacillus agarilyticus]
MLYEKAVFLRRIDAKTALIETQIKTSCNACQHNSDCGTGLIAKTLTPKTNQVPVLCVGEFEQGDVVTVQIEEQNLLIAAAVLYGLPLMCMIAVMLICAQIAFLPELLTIVIGFLGLAFGFYIAKPISLRYSKLPQIVDEQLITPFLCVETPQDRVNK